MLEHEKNQTWLNYSASGLREATKTVNVNFDFSFNSLGTFEHDKHLEKPHSTDDNRQDSYKPLITRKGLKRRRGASDRTRCVKQQHTLSSVATIRFYS